MIIHIFITFKVDLHCTTCNFGAKDLNLLEEHITGTHPESDEFYKCEQCEFRTCHEPSVEAHVNSVHEGRKCEFCSFVGTTRGTLKHHITAKHTRGAIQLSYQKTSTA